MNKIKAIIVDLGKTLMFFPEEKSLGLRLSELTGMDAARIDAHIIGLYTRKPGMTPDEFTQQLRVTLNLNRDPRFSEKVDRIVDEYVRSAQLQPGVLAVLDELRRREYRLALISNTTPLSHICIRELGIFPMFDCVLFSCDIGYLKPDPRIFLRAMQCLDVTPLQTCIVGDRIRTIILGGTILGANLVLLETQISETIMSEQIAVSAIIPIFAELLNLPMLGGAYH